MELASLDQEHVDLSSLTAVRQELVNNAILLHKDRGVKSYAACCLADILRLYAPDAPYTQSQLRDIFQFFFRQLFNGLKGTDSPYYSEYFHLLESLSTVKTVVLVCDLPTADDIMSEIFRDLFNLVRRDLPKRIEIFIADILVALIDECQVLSADVLETILSQFMDHQSRSEQAGRRLAVQVCNATADKLQRHVCQHFTDIIVSNSRDEDFTEIRTAHELIKRLHCSCPGLLHSVIPQLEEELRVEEVTLRVLATQVLGEMFADKSGGDLIRKFPATWNLWILRKNDKSTAVRIKFVEAARSLLINLIEQRDVLEDSLRTKLLDPDEKVRATVCKIYGQLDYETALHHVSDTQLQAISERVADKKQAVRIEASMSLGKLYSQAYSEIESEDSAAMTQFAWIPDTLLKMTKSGMEVRSVVEQTFMDFILPLPSPTQSTSKPGDVVEVAWTDRILNVMKNMDEEATIKFLTFSGFKQMQTRPNVYDHFLEACIQYNGGIIDDREEHVARRLNSFIQYLSTTFLDTYQAAADLQAFAKLNEGRLYKLMKTCIDPQTDLKNLIKATHEYQKRLHQSCPSNAPTLILLLRRSSFLLLNQSSIPVLLRRISKGCTDATSNSSRSSPDQAHFLLKFISKHVPALYKAHLGELMKFLGEDKNAGIVETCLHALAGVFAWDKSLIPTDKRIRDRMMRFVLSSNWRHSKFAARILAFSGDHETRTTMNLLIQDLSHDLSDEEGEQVLARVAVLVQVAKLSPQIFEQKSDEIMHILLNKILKKPSSSRFHSLDIDEEWLPDHEVTSVLRAKILSLKVCRNRSLAHATSEDALEIFAPVMKMFLSMLENNGLLMGQENEDPKFLSRLRLQAAISLLHLSKVDVYAQELTSKFSRLALTIQDSCYNVRISFLTKLLSLLQPRVLPPRYNVIPFLTVLDPEEEVKDTASTFIQGALRKMPPHIRSEHFELSFIHLLHLLAHHPDFAKKHEELCDTAKYIQCYLALVATPDNIPLLYHLAMKCKTVCDRESYTHTENLYAVSELAQELIKVHARLHSWSIQSYPGRVLLPVDIFRPLPNAEAVKKIVKTVYLPDETITWLAEIGKPNIKTSASSRSLLPKERKASKRKFASKKANGQAKRSRMETWRSEDEGSEDEVSDFDSADDGADAPLQQSKVRKAVSAVEDAPIAKHLDRGGRTTRSATKARERKQTSRESVETVD